MKNKQSKDEELAKIRAEAIEEATEDFKTAAKVAREIFGAVTPATICGVQARIFQWEEQKDQLQALDDLKASAQVADVVMPRGDRAVDSFLAKEQHALLAFGIYDATFDVEDDE